jgi:hypothetical protein
MGTALTHASARKGITAMPRSKDNEHQTPEEELHALRLQTKLAAYRQLHKAIANEVFDDAAKLAKDALSVMAKEDQTSGAREAVRFQMVSSFADEYERRRYVAATQPQIRKLLGDVAKADIDTALSQRCQKGELEE